MKSRWPGKICLFVSCLGFFGLAGIFAANTVPTIINKVMDYNNLVKQITAGDFTIYSQVLLCFTCLIGVFVGLHALIDGLKARAGYTFIINSIIMIGLLIVGFIDRKASGVFDGPDAMKGYLFVFGYLGILVIYILGFAFLFVWEKQYPKHPNKQKKKAA